MLTLTDSAASEIRILTTNPEIPDDAGLRIAASEDGANLILSLATEPSDGDAVIENGGARVFLEATASTLLADQSLDTAVDAEGKTRFAVNPQAA